MRLLNPVELEQVLCDVSAVHAEIITQHLDEEGLVERTMVLGIPLAGDYDEAAELAQHPELVERLMGVAVPEGSEITILGVLRAGETLELLTQPGLVWGLKEMLDNSCADPIHIEGVRGPPPQRGRGTVLGGHVLVFGVRMTAPQEEAERLEFTAYEGLNEEQSNAWMDSCEAMMGQNLTSGLPTDLFDAAMTASALQIEMAAMVTKSMDHFGGQAPGLELVRFHLEEPQDNRQGWTVSATFDDGTETDLPVQLPYDHLPFLQPLFRSFTRNVMILENEEAHIVDNVGFDEEDMLGYEQAAVPSPKKARMH